ncbi:hypothetical protein [Micromonospora sp. NPDC051141]|uniref:hypothetical protein n=1 Tax=Micromonospora sp. NPDC051141 TaxID=3364284 RepID=UPI0037B05EF5
MRRILVVGSSGAGKSTVAGELARRLDLPLIHLDRHYWRPGWVASTATGSAPRWPRSPPARPG